MSMVSDFPPPLAGEAANEASGRGLTPIGLRLATQPTSPVNGGRKCTDQQGC